MERREKRRERREEERERREEMEEKREERRRREERKMGKSRRRRKREGKEGRGRGISLSLPLVFQAHPQLHPSIMIQSLQITFPTRLQIRILSTEISPLCA